MAYLTFKDFWVIQKNELDQITQNDPTRLYKALGTAQEELTSYLVQRFDTTREFSDTMVWSYAKSGTYLPGDRVVLDFPAFSNTTAYNIGDTTIYNGVAYVSNGSYIAQPFNASNFTRVGNQYDILTVNYPYKEFYSSSLYVIGDVVYWNGYIYTCATESTLYTNESIIQFPTYAAIPSNNVFPDSQQNIKYAYWNNKTAYVMPSGTLPNNIGYWTYGDNRSSQMVMYMTDIAIYHLHKSISPQNVPDMRKEAYKAALKWLTMIAMGEITANLPRKQPTQGLKVRWGGNVRTNNHY